MKTMYYLLVVSFLALGCDSAVSKEKEANEAKTDKAVEWLTNFEQAKTTAEKQKVRILADFSGSDWCGWCMKLDSEVFSTTEFREYAKDNLVLFLADFPSQKEQPEDLKNQNRALAETYGVSGFPTVLVLDAEGNVLGRTGYRRGGAGQYVEHLKELAKGSEK